MHEYIQNIRAKIKNILIYQYPVKLNHTTKRKVHRRICSLVRDTFKSGNCQKVSDGPIFNTIQAKTTLKCAVCSTLSEPSILSELSLMISSKLEA